MERGMTLGESTVISNREVIGGFIMQLRKYIYKTAVKRQDDITNLAFDR
jgi:hypothetical protein